MDIKEAAQSEMPKYQCHKQVWALKIADIKQAPEDQERRHNGGDWYIVPEDKRYAPICVGYCDFIRKHDPEIGGYYVVYEGGYSSYSPADAFEDGYTLIA